jgi:hypothetical protein
MIGGTVGERRSQHHTPGQSFASAVAAEGRRPTNMRCSENPSRLPPQKPPFHRHWPPSIFVFRNHWFAEHDNQQRAGLSHFDSSS